MITIQNDNLIVQINELGAQLHSIKRTDQPYEYLWQGQTETSWKRQAPVLFPFVGRLAYDKYTYKGQEYHQTQHGFARDKEFSVAKQTADTVTFKLVNDDQTMAAYPFEFELLITYRVVNDQLLVNYQVQNPSTTETLIYGLGAHPGFNMPLTAGAKFEDGTVTITPGKVMKRFKIADHMSDRAHAFDFDMTKPLALDHELFNEDAIVLELNGEPATVTLTDPIGNHGVEVSLIDTPFVGIWSAYPNTGNFVCVEPWWGLADDVHSDGQLEHKEPMHHLAPNGADSYSFAIKPY